MEVKLLRLSPEANFCLQVLHLFVQWCFQSPLVLQFRDDQSSTLHRDTVNDIIKSFKTVFFRAEIFFFPLRGVLKSRACSFLP